MSHDLSKAKELLLSDHYTCVLCKGTELHVSRHRGVRPLLDLLENGTDLQGFSAADKVVGKATAMLYRLLRVQRVYGVVMSQAAMAVLQEGNIEVSYETMVDHIVNRTGDGPCPMEAATAVTNDPAEALRLIKLTLTRLQGGTQHA